MVNKHVAVNSSQRLEMARNGSKMEAAAAEVAAEIAVVLMAINQIVVISSLFVKTMRLYQSACPSVCSVGPSVRPSVGNQLFFRPTTCAKTSQLIDASFRPFFQLKTNYLRNRPLSLYHIDLFFNG